MRGGGRCAAAGAALPCGAAHAQDLPALHHLPAAPGSIQQVEDASRYKDDIAHMQQQQFVSSLMRCQCMGRAEGLVI